jgi:MoxR-like ATPase
MVIATQNPIEHEGTYPLPESQLDRFVMRLSMGYPSRDSELEILDTRVAREVHVAQTLKRYIVDITESTRDNPDIYLGASPRASLYLLKAARAVAASRGRDYVVPDDIQDLIVPVLAHRVLLSPEAQMRGATTEGVLEALVGQVPIPARKQA